MPNFRIPDSLREAIRKTASAYTARTESYALANFPLTLEQMQRAVLAPEQVATLDRMTQQGIRTIERFSEVNVLFRREQVPGLLRGVVFALHMPEGIFLRHRTWNIYGEDPALPRPDYAMRLDLAHLSQDDLAAFAVWANAAVRQHRLVRIADRTIYDITDTHISTSAHLNALWPFLTTLVKDPMWRQKLATKIRSPQTYAPKPDVVQTYAKRMGVAELVITQGSMLTPYQYPPNAIRASLAWWEMMSGDTRY